MCVRSLRVVYKLLNCDLINNTYRNKILYQPFVANHDHFCDSGAKRVRQLFAAAKAKAPCVLFIDEIDTCGAKRTSSQLHPYANQTINQLLAEMDGFNKSEGVVVLGKN